MNKAATRRAVVAFTRAISDNDVAAMAKLMSDDHAFIDSRERRVEGRDACLEGWREWFEGYPGYACEIKSLVVQDDHAYLAGEVQGGGAPYDGHALWRARCRDGRIVEWQIYRASRNNVLPFRVPEVL